MGEGEGRERETDEKYKQQRSPIYSVLLYNLELCPIQSDVVLLDLFLTGIPFLER